MSFSSTAKGELCRTELTGECCELSELSAMIHTAGSISISGGAFTLRIDTENAAVARRAFLLVKSLYGVHTKTEMHTNQLKHNHIYSLAIDAASARMVALDTRLIGEEGISFGTDASFLSGQCCKIAFARGAFLGGGSITNPERRYHMEFVCNQKEFAFGLLNIIKELGCPAKMIPRNKSFVVYLKEGDAIVTLLTMMGAHSSILNIENIRIMKSVRNSVNRKVNCETGNLSKTVNASVKQQESIEYIRNHMGLDKLAPGLREVAEARLSNPEASLEELVELLGAASKSGVNHKLRRINSIAEQLKTTRG
ncbi:MAG: DNA-binding protein WhiA [Eubacteriales bacterium]|nr:DNA-binding protein WhiA [Eubacteriales bacterium]